MGLSLPKCSRLGCSSEVKRAESKFCSRYCQRLANCKHERPAIAKKASDSFVVDGNKGEVTKLVDKRIKTLRDLVDACEIDLTEWDIERWICNKWEMGAVPVPGKIVVTPLFQVKVWLVRKVALNNIRKEVEAIVADAKKQIPRSPWVFKPVTVKGNMLELSIPDLHFGKLAWAKETGWNNYDIKIAEAVFEDAVEALLSRTATYQFEKILFIVGNDLFHSDNPKGETFAGTPLDVDSRYHKSFYKVRQMITRTTEKLSILAPVDVMTVPGNHDTLSVWHLGDSLECYFHQSKRVTIDNEPKMRKYYQFGKVMLMFTHGNKGNLKDYPNIMATEQPEMWGQTIHREAHTGDKHHLKVNELHGTKVRISPALCPPDAWHAENTFIGASRSAEAFVWNKSEGLIGTANYTVQSPGK